MVDELLDRRVFDRLATKLPVKFKHSPEDFGTDVVLQDISPSGARIMTRNRVALDQSVDLLVEIPDGHEPLSLEGKVVWISSQGVNQWGAGVQFNKVRLMNFHRLFKLFE